MIPGRVLTLSGGTGLSLAQIASLGAAIAVWQGYDPHEPAIYWMSLALILVGALIFAVIKGHEAKTPQEAIIGISYAVASAVVILTMSKSSGQLVGMALLRPILVR
jgi:hypothetical protein